jgi:tetratricopeptide (TPR) repeat protein
MEVQHSPTLDQQSSHASNLISSENKSSGEASISARTLIYLKNAKVLQQNHEHSLSINLLRQASSLSPHHPLVLKALGESLEKAKKWDEAYLVFKHLGRVRPDFYSFYKIAEMEYVLQNDDLSLQSYFECLSHLVEDCDELFNVYKNIGNMLVKQKDYDGAEEYFNKAHAKNSKSDVLFVNFGTLEIQREDFNKAVFCFRQALEINPKNDKAWIGLSFVHSGFGDHELAWGNLMTALDINRTNKTGLLFMMNWIEDSSKAETIKTRLIQFLEVDGFDQDVSLLLSQMFIREKNFDAAKNCIEVLKLYYPENEKLDLIMTELQKGEYQHGPSVEV